jgi:hypothetical protein
MRAPPGQPARAMIGSLARVALHKAAGALVQARYRRLRSER